MGLTKEEALRKIHNCAIAYKENLIGKNILFVTLIGNKYLYFETAFHARNFLHFTGVVSSLRSTMFFRAALKNKLSTHDIELITDGTTELKLEVLPKLMNIHLTARMAGDYDKTKSLLVTDKLAGTTAAVMGFVEDNGYYIPNTVMKEDLQV